MKTPSLYNRDWRGNESFQSAYFAGHLANIAATSKGYVLSFLGFKNNYESMEAAKADAVQFVYSALTQLITAIPFPDQPTSKYQFEVYEERNTAFINCYWKDAEGVTRRDTIAYDLPIEEANFLCQTLSRLNQHLEF